jgi:hypothetical protein
MGSLFKSRSSEKPKPSLKALLDKLSHPAKIQSKNGERLCSFSKVLETQQIFLPFWNFGPIRVYKRHSIPKREERISD